METEHSSWLLVLAQRFAVPHVLGTLSTQIGPLHQQVGQPVQTHADGERGDEAVQTPQHNAQGPAENQQHQQPDDAPETRAARHPLLQEHQTQLFNISFTHYSFFKSVHKIYQAVLFSRGRIWVLIRMQTHSCLQNINTSLQQCFSANGAVIRREWDQIHHSLKGTVHPEKENLHKSTQTHLHLGQPESVSSSDLEKCSIVSLAQQWMLCSEWVPSEWESKQLIKTSQ